MRHEIPKEDYGILVSSMKGGSDGRARGRY